MTSFQSFQKQQKFLASLKDKRPDLLATEKAFREEEVLPQIGITTLDPKRPEGFLRLFPQDFVVEELRKDKGLSQIEPQENIPPQPKTEKFTLYADLIKVGISTIEAISRLSKALKINSGKIGYAGIKDAKALTSQRIALPGITLEKVQKVKKEGFFLTNFSYAKGTLDKGDLRGNIFTIFVRTQERIPRAWLQEKLLALKENGFLNYYYTQRFGGKRLLSHILGRLILQGEYEAAIQLFLSEPSDYSINITRKLRLRAAERYSQWREMKKIFEVLPFTFQNEIRALEYLVHHPDNFIGTLFHIEDQTKLWAYAYASLLFNNLLSWAQENNKALPEKVPLLLSDDPDDWKYYEPWLLEDKIQDIKKALEPLKFIRLKKRLTPTCIFPTNILAKSTPEGAALSFHLSKGAYATTLLANLFKLQEGMPLPSWLKTKQVDVKKILDLGTVKPAQEKLKDYIFSAVDYIDPNKKD